MGTNISAQYLFQLPFSMLSGAGKSYTMMGAGDDLGLIPRLCGSLFSRIESATSEQTQFNVEVSGTRPINLYWHVSNSVK